jgi:hypothetical protein
VVQDLRFTDYAHVSPTRLRFVVDHPDRLPEGVEAVVRYVPREVARFTLPRVAQP